ncbi:hypothetical protein BH09MYX1_BH09MYX1_28660 [soil metagenome]
MKLLVSVIVLGAALVGCSAAPSQAPPTGTKIGKTFANAADAPVYAGTAFSAMQIYDLDASLYLDEAALLEALDDDALVFFGEKHETAPVQELELWLLTRMTTRHDDVTLGMEHFQHDEQPIIDNYLAGTITTAEFEQTSAPWTNYAVYWKPLVEHMKSIGRPMVGLNVPDEALNELYGKFPASPFTTFNSWTSASPYDSAIAPRPIPKWDDTYEAYFESSFDYAAHGQKLGLSYADALVYFSDLAVIRDETMAYFTAQALAQGGRVVVVAGDWHVQTGLATPDRAVRWAGAATKTDLLTTTPKAQLEAIRNATVSGRKLAHFVLVYQ